MLLSFFVEVDLHDLIDYNLEDVLNLLSEKATGSPYLTDIRCRAVGVNSLGQVQLVVEGVLAEEYAERLIQ